MTAVALLSLGAGLDIITHSLLMLPTFMYALGRSACRFSSDFTIPWQHLQRVRNAVTPLLLGSVCGMLHPFAGITMSEPTDKHIALGILSSNTDRLCTTPCSPLHSFSMIERIAQKHRYVIKNGVKHEIFSAEHLRVIRDVKEFETSLECLQAQEYVHKVTNFTLYVMASIKMGIEGSSLNSLSKNILVRVAGVCIPVLTAVDLLIALIVQSIFLVTGVVRMVSGRGPIYTEVTSNPLMHVAFLIQSLLKAYGNLVGVVVWFISPMESFNLSLLPANSFFKVQMGALMSKIRDKIDSAKDGTRFAVPIGYNTGESSSISLPVDNMHKTYLIVEKKEGMFKLFWVNRPKTECREGLDSLTALTIIQSMIDTRFPFMDIKKMMNYPIKNERPKIDATSCFETAYQGNDSNCVVSNLFEMLNTLDKIRGEKEEIPWLRYSAVRASLMKDYAFYKDDFSPFAGPSYTLKNLWKDVENHPDAAI